MYYKVLVAGLLGAGAILISEYCFTYSRIYNLIPIGISLTAVLVVWEDAHEY